MNKMADNVLQKMEAKQKQEDDMLMRFEREREARQVALEQRRAEKAAAEKERMRQYLSAQVQEKHEREKNDKENISQQAQMWAIDKQNYQLEEQRLKEKIDRIKMDNQAYLLKQMELKNQKSTKMNKAEFALNKPLLREANQKLKGMSMADAGSQ